MLSACAGDHALAAKLADAAKPARLPEVVACWEKEFDAASTQPRYEATVDFVVEGGTSRIQRARVRSIVATDDEDRTLPPTGREEGLGACIEAALDRSALPTSADGEGPGFSISSDLRVEGFRIEFVDASAKKRALAEARQSHVLIGPRADRCKGLYAHEPPRDASTLYEEISKSESRALSADDLDQRARDLQKTYDAKLELIERLSADLGEPDLPEVNRERVREALDGAIGSAKKTGALIGCEPVLPAGAAAEKKRR